MSAAQIIPIVEGQSEVESVPVLLRRFLSDSKIYDVESAKPFRVRRNLVVKEGELEKTIVQALKTRPNAAAVLLILDSDDDCPAELGPCLLERCTRTTQLPVAVVLAKAEFECWLLGAKESLRGVRGIRNDATSPEDPERIRDGKGRLSLNMEGRVYVSVDDQPALAAKMDFDLAAERCPSFRKLVREVEYLVEQIRKQG